jgi:glycerophosphoryl diester phosphodiesterase
MTPKIIAHRGASVYAPENTLAAFELALELGADGIELDVMLSKDGKLVVIHDDTVDRTTDGTGRVKDLTLEELQSFNAGGHEKIPGLDEVFDLVGGKFLINVELKNYRSLFDALPVEVAKLVEARGLQDSVLISSFNFINLPRFRRHLPGVNLGLLTLPGQARYWIWRLFRYDALNPFYRDVNEALVTRLHARDRQINVWTCDDPDEIRRMAALGVDGIITNDPKNTKKVLES